MPVLLREELLHLHHDGKVGGHFGFLKVLLLAEGPILLAEDVQ